MMIVAIAAACLMMLSHKMFTAAFTFQDSSSLASPDVRLAMHRRIHCHPNEEGGFSATTSCLFETSSSSDDGVGAETEEFPALLSEEEIRSLLDAIPVYAVTGTNQEGIVLVKESGNDNDIANFFFSSEMASSYYAPLLQAKMDSGEHASWGVAKFTLGFVWFDVLKNPAPAGDGTNSDVINAGVEYRLVPDAKELAGAQSIYQASQQLRGAKANPNIFKKSYNEIPIFMDRQIRDKDNENIMPMYFGLQDLIKSIQDQTDNEFKAEMNIEDFHSVIQEMQKDTSATINFRKVSFVAPTALPSMTQQQ